MTAPAITSTALPAVRPTVPLVRQQVREILEQSPTFQALPEARRRALAHDMVNVGQYLADAGGTTYGAPLAAAISQDAGRELGAPVRGLADPPDTAGQKFSAQG